MNELFRIFGTIALNSADAEKGLDRIEGKAKSSQKAISDFSKMMMGLGVVATGAAVLVRDQFDQADATIRKSTGATGEAFEALRKDLRATARQTEQSIGSVAGVIGELNTRLGATGDELQDLTLLTLNFAKVTDQDAVPAAAMLGKLMNALELDISETESLMDKLTFASQQSGISVATLGQLILDAGPSFEELGFNLDRSIALFSSFERAGANPREVVSSLNLVLNKMAKDGATNAEEAFNMLIESIKDAPSILEATSIAAEAFGSRVGAKVAEDIRAGRFEVDAFAEAVANSGGTMQATADDVFTFRDQLNLMKNNLIVLLEPLGSMAPMLLAITTAIPGLIAAVNGARIAFAFFNAVLIANPIGLIILAIAALVAAGILLWKNWDTVKEKAGQLWEWLKNGFKAMTDAVLGAITGLLNGIRDAFMRIVTAIGGAIDSIDARFAPFLFLLGPLGALAAVWKFRDEIIGAFNMVKDRVGGVIDWIKARWQELMGIIDSVKGALASIPSPGSILGGAADVGRGILGRIPGFDTGGTVPGPVGSPQLIMAHGGETVLPTHRGPVQPNVNITFAEGMGWLRNFVRVEMEGELDWMQSSGARIAGGG